jgi:ribosomal protein S6--L-glutamate ligase
MKIAILTHNIHSQSHQRLVEVGNDRGHEMSIINISYCYMNISANKPAIYYRNNDTFEGLEAIIPRIKRDHTYYGTALLRQFERLGIFTLNSSLSIVWARDKLRALQQLAKHQLPMPLIGVADSPQESEELIELVGGVPLIVRLLEGTEGKGSIIAETPQAALSVINAFKQLKNNILVQEYIKEAKGYSIRAIVVGNKVIGSALRKTALSTNEKRKFFDLEPITITSQENKLALRAAKILKLNLAYVDLIRSERGPLVLDIEASPNIETLEKTTKIDISTPILEFIEEHAKKKNG